MRIAFFGAAHEVTGSCTVIYANGKTIMVDCGLEQGPDIYENCELPMQPFEIDCVLLTHAHIDHSGKIPALVAGGFNGCIYTTTATKRLCDIMLLDSAYIQESEAAWRNKKAARAGEEPYKPLYTVDDVYRTLDLIECCSYDTPISIGDGIEITFTDAGHLLGSASITVKVTEDGRTQSIVFSGDLGNSRRPLIRDMGQPAEADYVVIESTYGDRLHGERIDYVTAISEVIQRTFDRGGNLVIPAFAVGRTQELLYLLRIIKERGLVKGHGDFPVYLDSPLAIEATEIYSEDLREFFDEETLALLDEGKDPIRLSNLRLSVTADDSIRINHDKTPKIIISASGMCEAGRIRHHLKHNLWRRESTVLFVGYQSEGTLGRIILDGAPKVKLFGEEIRINAEILKLAGISSHADRDMLLGWLDGYEKKPTTVFVNHGSDTVCDSFAAAVESSLGIEAIAPYNGAQYDLLSGVCLEVGNRQRIVKGNKKAKNPRKLEAYKRLVSAGRKLTMLIESSEDASIKDMAKLTAQINSILDKWK